jgi:hypothetical protein
MMLASEEEGVSKLLQTSMNEADLASHQAVPPLDLE